MSPRPEVQILNGSPKTPFFAGLPIGVDAQYSIYFGGGHIYQEPTIFGTWTLGKATSHTLKTASKTPLNPASNATANTQKHQTSPNAEPYRVIELSPTRPSHWGAVRQPQDGSSFRVNNSLIQACHSQRKAVVVSRVCV